LIHVCSDLGSSAMALLDHDGVYGSPRFHIAAKKLGIKAHIGSEISFNLEPRNSSHTPTTSLPLLAETRIGYQNLCRLITMMKLRAPKHAKPGEVAASLDELAEHSEGLICLTGGDDGPVARAIEIGGFDEALSTIEKLAAIFGRRNIYAELQRHFNRDEESRNQVVIEIA